ncbi:MAG: type VI secretion system baseplate subunit TssE [Pseudoxanthomonas sp.]
MATLFDRLQEDSPDARSANGLRASVSRDLEHLLNTRSEGARLIPDAFPECRKSLLTFGIPDFSAYSLLSPQDRDRIRRQLEQSIALHEPRLSRVRISLEAPAPLERALRFRVDALLALEQDREKVQFDAVLQLSTQVYQVR